METCEKEEKDNGDNLVEFSDWKRQKKKHTRERESLVKKREQEKIFLKWFELNYRSSKWSVFLYFIKNKVFEMLIWSQIYSITF